MLGLGEGVKPNSNFVRIVNIIDIYGPSLNCRWVVLGWGFLENSSHRDTILKFVTLIACNFHL